MQKGLLPTPPPPKNLAVPQLAYSRTRLCPCSSAGKGHLLFQADKGHLFFQAELSGAADSVGTTEHRSGIPTDMKIRARGHIMAAGSDIFVSRALTFLFHELELGGRAVYTVRYVVQNDSNRLRTCERKLHGVMHDSN